MVRKKKIPKTRKFDGKVYRKRHRGVIMTKGQAQKRATRIRRASPKHRYHARVVPVRIKDRTATWTAWVIYTRR